MNARPKPQHVIVYGPADEPVVYATAPPDPAEARMAMWECQQRYPRENVRLTAADLVPPPPD